MKRTVSTGQAPQAIGPYSQAIVTNGMVFLSGQIPLDPSTNQLIEGGIAEQTERVLKNLKAVLEAFLAIPRPAQPCKRRNCRGM